jgi:cytochrome c551/c552
VRHAGILALVCSLPAGAAAQAPDRELLKQACVVCHNAAQPVAGLMLDKIDPEQIGRDAEVWEKVARKLRTGLHPPAGPTRPQARALDTLAQGIERALDRLDSSNWSAGASSPASDLELASRLSAFLWRSWPDEELLELAAAGRLRTPGVLERQTRRMLTDPRSDALISNFFNQWLMLRNLANHRADQKIFPGVDDALRQALLRETELFLRSQVRDDRGVPELVTANYTFMNDRVAKHYGVPNVTGPQFRRVPLPDGRRAGLLGHGSILAITSYATRTSPVLRGMWLLETFFGTPMPPVPANVPALPEDESKQPAASVRGRLERHTRNPACAACHVTIDPLGYALENFDGVGRWRAMDAGMPINATSALPDGTPLDGPAGLRSLLTSRRDVVVTTVVDRLMTYALGRRITYYDMPSVRGIVRDAASADYRWSAIIAGVVKSTPFQMKRNEQR